jgi:hypothetical protein
VQANPQIITIALVKCILITPAQAQMQRRSVRSLEMPLVFPKIENNAVLGVLAIF